jgi:hypothetical protein
MNEDVQVAYKEGIKEGIRRYAIWVQGEQVVGVLKKPLKEVLAEVDKETVPRTPGR